MKFTLVYGTTSSISADTQDWGVSTVGQAVNHPNSKTVFRLPDNVLTFVSGVQVQGSALITDGVTIQIQKDANGKGRI